jgi:hypothetical protein
VPACLFAPAYRPFSEPQLSQKFAPARMELPQFAQNLAGLSGEPSCFSASL